MELLCAAARRGVSVEILLPGPHTDKRVCLPAGQRYYEDLTVSEPISPGRWKRRSPVRRAREASVVPIRRYL